LCRAPVPEERKYQLGKQGAYKHHLSYSLDRAPDRGVRSETEQDDIIKADPNEQKAKTWAVKRPGIVIQEIEAAGPKGRMLPAQAL